MLFLSLLCNFYFCINRKCNKESGLILKESLTIPLQILEENVPNDNQRISLVEMHEIPVYESINENQMLSNLALAMQSNGRTVRQLKQSQSTSQLMKNNKSLTSSPCDDMNTVSIAEQKAKDSVGKENGMNLSDHESSESDGDIDAMCGNGDGYLHSYVPLMTNCMEYLHSYSSLVINNSPVINSSLVINSSAIINEDQLMKTKSSKLKENELCKSVMNVTNDEDYTDQSSR